MDKVTNYKSVSKISWKFEKIKKSKGIGKEYKFFKIENKEVLKGIVKRYKLDEEYGVSILKTYGEILMEYLNPVVNTNIIKIIIILKGQCSLITSNRKLQVEKGDIIIYRVTGNIKKSIFESNNLETLTINVYIDKFEKNLKKSMDKETIFNWNNKIFNILDEKLFYLGKSDSKIEVLSKNIYKSKIANVEEYFIFKMQVFKLILIILELPVKSLENQQENINVEKKIYEIKKIIEESNFENMPKIKEICNLVGLSNYQMQKMFKMVEKITVSQYIIKMKMQYAKILLEQGNKNILDISYAVGYENPSKFSQVFKKYYGILPSKFKNEILK